MTDGFTEVKYKGNRKKYKPFISKRPFVKSQTFDVDVNAVKRRIYECSRTLKSSRFLSSLFTLISESFTQLDEVLCYGLGNFSESYISRTQLATLLEIKEQYKAKVWVYDPLFCCEEKSILISFGIGVIAANEEGKRTLSPVINTLAFFPHCPKQLVNNFIWANWGIPLRNCLVWSNSFASIVEKNTKTTLDGLSCLRDVIKIVKEAKVCELEGFEDVFNDLSVHSFNSLAVPKEFWTVRQEPVYTGDVEFIIRDEFEKLNIEN